MLKMSIEAKEAFINRIRMKLSDWCIPVQTDKMLGIISDCLFGFDIDVTENDNVYIGEDFLEMFINALKVQGRAEGTITRYKYEIEKLLAGAETTANEITVHHIRAFLASEKERGISDNTLEGNRQVYSSFFGWLYREGLIPKNPIVNLGSIKVPKKLKEAYSEVDIELLKQNCDNSRDVAIVSFLLATACRISEVINLNIDDVDFRNLECIVRGKGNKERKVYLDEVTSLFLKEYIVKRDDDNEALFVGLKKPHNRLQPPGVRAMLAKLGIEADVYHVYPHKFRRTKATNLIKHGMPIHEVAAILGHDKLDTTMEYIAIDDNTVKHDYHKFG